MTTLKLTEHVKRRIAVAAEVDPRSVMKFCKGLPLRPMPKERIERALRAEHLLPDEGAKTK
jgi:hypothetical protein